MRKGYFIALEGLNGSGKSTQAKMLFDWLKKFGVNCVLYRDPGTSPMAEELRKLVRNPEIRAEKETILLLYVAARIELLATIRKELEDNRVVIVDRWIWSTIAYQGFGQGIPLDKVNLLLKNFNDLRPNLTLFLDIPPSISARRLVHNPGETTDRWEASGLEFTNRLYSGYKTILANYIIGERLSREVLSFDAIQSADTVSDNIKDCITRGGLLRKFGHHSL